MIKSRNLANNLKEALAIANRRAYIAPIGLIPGGTTGQILMKASSADYDVYWADLVAPNIYDGGFFDSIFDGVNLDGGSPSDIYTVTYDGGHI